MHAILRRLAPLLGLLVLLTGAVRAEEERQPLLWRIDGDPPSYLFGTIHLPDQRVLDLMEVVDSAFRDADAFYAELDMRPHNMMKVQLEVILSGGRTLADVLPEDLYQELDKYLQTKGMALVLPLTRMKVWAIEAQLGLLDYLMDFASNPPLDQHLFDRARRAGKEVGGIETVREQIDIFDSQTEEEQIAALRETLKTLSEVTEEGDSPIEELVRLYLAGKSEDLQEYLDAEFDADDERQMRLKDALLTQRNVRMAERCDEKLRKNPGRKFFFAFGAAHMPGAGGVVELLRQRGRKVQRMRADGSLVPMQAVARPGARRSVRGETPWSAEPVGTARH